jgi:hypothetical protein
MNYLTHLSNILSKSKCKNLLHLVPYRLNVSSTSLYFDIVIKDVKDTFVYGEVRDDQYIIFWTEDGEYTIFLYDDVSKIILYLENLLTINRRGLN